MRARLLKVKSIPAPLQVFLLAGVMYVLAVLPILIIHKGLFFYYGDYNVQQVPFYILAHRAVREGSFFWNWNLDLGGPLIGDLAFYLTGSPFFWLTIPFPERVVPYLFPFLMALKYACETTTRPVSADCCSRFPGLMPATLCSITLPTLSAFSRFCY